MKKIYKWADKHAPAVFWTIWILGIVCAFISYKAMLLLSAFIAAVTLIYAVGEAAGRNKEE